MGICYGTPDYPTPSFTGHLRPGTATSLTISSTSSSEAGESWSFGAVSDGVYLNEGTVPDSNARVFSLSELISATRNFRPDAVVGEGGFGKVFKGYLDEKVPSQGRRRTAIAVKKLKPESVQGFMEWKSEVNFLSSLSHPNIVKLLGYCWEDGALLLVYEFMPRGTLKNHLFGRGATIKPLSWKTRLKIAIGAAKGLDFLHGHERPIICRDFKSSNILLDGAYDARISDFGLAKEGPAGDQSHVSTQVLGTVGYAAPEYIATGHLYVKSDVFSYGVVLVELLTGLRAYDPNRSSEQEYLVDWVKPRLSKRKLARVMDYRLEGRYPLEDALQVAVLAFQCLQSDPKARPSMKEVVEKLQNIASCQ